MSDQVQEVEDEEVTDDQVDDQADDDFEEYEEGADIEEVPELEDAEPDDAEFFGIWNKDSVAKQLRIKCLLYGVSGTGKTTMAATFPKPLFLDLEGGMHSTLLVGDVWRYPANPQKDITDYSQIVEFYYKIVERLKDTSRPFPVKTIVIDSLNELQTHITQNVVSRYTKVKRQYNDQLTLADYGKANRDFARVLRLFLRLPFHIVFTAAATPKEVGDEETQIIPKFVGRQVGPDVQRMTDMIGYLYPKKMGSNQPDQHMSSFKMTTAYMGKDRLKTTAREFPNNYDSLIKHIQVFQDGTAVPE